jgi:2-iminobutanoate/2-iminopropanoate deaminase
MAKSKKSSKSVKTKAELPATPLPFSLCVPAGGFLFVSGQASVDADGEIVVDSFEGEMRRSFDHVVAVLKSQGMTLDDVVQVRSYVAREKDLENYNKIYRTIFTPPFPARTTIVGVLGTALKYEVDVIAFPGGPGGSNKRGSKKKR